MGLQLVVYMQGLPSQKAGLEWQISTLYCAYVPEMTRTKTEGDTQKSDTVQETRSKLLPQSSDALLHLHVPEV